MVKTIKSKFRPFAEARDYVISLNFKSNKEYAVWTKSSDRPIDIPTTPEQVYKSEWIGWGDWLGTDTIAPQNRTFRPFAEARGYVISLNFKGVKEYNEWRKTSDRPSDIPSEPSRTYMLSKTVRNKVYSFDHVAINPSVIACDMAHTGLDDEILDVALFSLSLMGVNWQDYLKEAFRLLRSGGLLKVSEAASSWADNNYASLKNSIESAGFVLNGEPKLSSKFIYLDAIKPL